MVHPVVRLPVIPLILILLLNDIPELALLEDANFAYELAVPRLELGLLGRVKLGDLAPLAIERGNEICLANALARRLGLPEQRRRLAVCGRAGVGRVERFGREELFQAVVAESMVVRAKRDAPG